MSKRRKKSLHSSQNNGEFVDIEKVRRKLLDEITENKWNAYIVSTVSKRPGSQNIRLLPRVKGQMTLTGVKVFSRLSYEEKLNIILTTKFRRERLHRCIQGMKEEKTKEIFETNLSKTKYSQSIIIRALVSCVLGEQPDFIRRGVEKVNILQSSVNERLFVELNGVVVPKEIIDLILSYIKIDKNVLFSLGLTCSTFYLAVLQNWKTVVLNDTNFFDVSLLVLQNVQNLSFRKNIGNDGHSHIFSHISVTRLKSIELSFNKNRQINKFFRNFENNKRVKSLPIRKLSFLPPPSQSLVKVSYYDEKYISGMKKCLDSSGFHSFIKEFEISTFFPSLEILNHPPYLEGWFENGSQTIKKLRTTVNGFNLEEYERMKERIRSGNKKKDFDFSRTQSRFSIYEVINIGFPNLTHLFLEELVVAEDEYILTFFDLVAESFQELRVLTIRMFVSDGLRRVVDVTGLKDIPKLEAFRMIVFEESWSKYLPFKGEIVLPGSKPQINIPMRDSKKDEDDTEYIGLKNLKELRIRKIIWERQNVTHLTTFLSLILHQLTKLDLSLRVDKLRGYYSFPVDGKAKLKETISKIMGNLGSILVAKTRVYHTKDGFFELSYRKSRRTFCVSSIGRKKETGTRLPTAEGQFQDFSSSMLLKVLRDHFPPRKDINTSAAKNDKSRSFTESLYKVVVEIGDEYQAVAYLREAGERFLVDGWERESEENKKWKKYDVEVIKHVFVK